MVKAGLKIQYFSSDPTTKIKESKENKLINHHISEKFATL